MIQECFFPKYSGAYAKSIYKYQWGQYKSYPP